MYHLLANRLQKSTITHLQGDFLHIWNQCGKFARVGRQNKYLKGHCQNCLDVPFPSPSPPLICLIHLVGKYQLHLHKGVCYRQVATHPTTAGLGGANVLRQQELRLC